MAKKHILFDKTELVLMFFAGKNFKSLNVGYADIRRIQYDSIMERKFLFRTASEKITIITSKQPEPIVYTMLKEKAFWDEYKEKLAKFAGDNMITFINNL